MDERRSAALELVFAGALWGFGFVAAVWALRVMGPLTVTALRFVIAIAAGFTIAFLVPSLRRHLSLSALNLALIPGLLLSSLLILQTWGLQYTTATKSSFITTLYVLFVPILERLLLKRSLPRFHLPLVALALGGVALICDIPGTLAGEIRNSSWNRGDLLTLLCAIAASAHILWFAVIRDRIEEPFTFNLMQSLWAGAAPLSLALWLEQPWSTLESLMPASLMKERGDSLIGLIGLLSLALGSTLVAFTLQVRAQKVISPTLASLLFLLESPFATLFAIHLLGESLRTEQWVGAGLIMIAVVVSTIFDSEVTQQPKSKGPRNHHDPSNME